MSFAVIEKQGSTLTVRPVGSVDVVSTPLLDNELQPHLDGVRQIVMDFSGVDYISTSGLRLLLRLEKMTEERGGEVRLIHANEEVMTVLRLSGFMNVVRVAAD